VGTTPRQPNAGSLRPRLVRGILVIVNKRAFGVGAILVALGIAAVTAAWSVGSPSWFVVSHRPVFWIGLVVAAIGAVMQVVSILHPNAEIPAEHRAVLRETVRNVNDSVAANSRINYGDTPNGPERRKAAFDAHFRKSKPLIKILTDWDSSVHKLKMAEAKLHTHLHIRKDELEIRVPSYDESVIIDNLYNWVVAEARQANPSVIQINWRGFGHSLYPGLAHTAPWITVPRIDNETDDEWRARATEMHRPVDQLLDEAQTWQETLQIGPLWKEVRRLQKPTADALQSALIREVFKVARHCPFCDENRA
jgi:hypothetical protein